MKFNKNSLEKARKSLAGAKQINQTGYSEFAVSRAYSTMFYIASAFLEGENLFYLLQEESG